MLFTHMPPTNLKRASMHINHNRQPFPLPSQALHRRIDSQIQAIEFPQLPILFTRQTPTAL